MDLTIQPGKLEVTFSHIESAKRCRHYRRRILEVSQQVPALHIAGAFSTLEMMDCAYFGLMQHGSEYVQPDTFILSKGHAAIGQYIVLEHRGVLHRSDLDLYCKPGGRLGGHPDYGVPGINASTGSLAHGMGLAVGMAHADRIRGDDRKVFLLMSDGELQEGSVWESMMMAANLGVSNLVGFLDHNGFQSFGRTIDNHPSFYPIKEKVEAFGWECTVVDGHDSRAIMEAIYKRTGDRPFLLIGDTVKGRGVSFMESEPIWHFRSPSQPEFEKAMFELRD